MACFYFFHALTTELVAHHTLSYKFAADRIETVSIACHKPLLPGLVELRSLPGATFR
jgi:hypothetical protein